MVEVVYDDHRLQEYCQAQHRSGPTSLWNRHHLQVEEEVRLHQGVEVGEVVRRPVGEVEVVQLNHHYWLIVVEAEHNERPCGDDCVVSGGSLYGDVFF